VNVVEQTRVAASPERVWAALADFGHISRWADNVDHSTLLTDRRDGVGAVRRVQLGRNALLETIVEWEPGSGLAYSVEGLPPVVRGVVNAWSLEDAGGATVVRLTARIDANPLVGLVVGRVMGRELRRLVTGLKAHVEGGAR